jgi:murein DD-endopeptidase MepM/ murein hydrolase activator NlpD
VVAAATSPRGRRLTRKAIAGIASLALVCALCTGGVAVFVAGLLDDSLSAAYRGCGTDASVDPNGPLPELSELTEDQMRIAAIIVKVGQELAIPPRGWVIAIATALQESRLTNHPNLGASNDHDSIGVFQQRPSQGWGTVEQLSDPEYQARKFYDRLATVAGWQSLPLTVAAQKVQRSAYPNAYAKHEPLAAIAVDVLTGGAGRAAGADLVLRCAAAGEIAASGWTVPVLGELVSGFRTSSRPGHNGVDIAVPKGTPILAAAAGVVLTARCNAHSGGLPYSCDRDGGIFVQGCGWYVDILHAANVITRYCHMAERPYVTPGMYLGAGQIIGASGSSGHSSGPHLHFEVHVNADSSRFGAIDPVPFMQQAGASLVGAA